MVASVTPLDGLRSFAPVPEHLELNGLDYVGQLLCEQITDLVVMRVDTWTDRHLSFGCDRMDAKRFRAARATIVRQSCGRRNQRFAHFDRLTLREHPF